MNTNEYQIGGSMLQRYSFARTAICRWLCHCFDVYPKCLEWHVWGYNNIPETLLIYLTDSYKNVKHSFQPQRRVCSHIISTSIIYICINYPQYYSRDDFQKHSCRGTEKR